LSVTGELVFWLTCIGAALWWARLKDFERIYEYDGNATCAADGMCQEKCPVKINTGELIKAIRAEDMSKQTTASNLAMSVARHFSGLSSAVPSFLNVVDMAHGLLGPKPLEVVSQALNKASGRMVPVWTPYMPAGASPLKREPPLFSPLATLLPLSRYHHLSQPNESICLVDGCLSLI
jgi:Fe-S oxidoreductase